MKKVDTDYGFYEVWNFPEYVTKSGITVAKNSGYAKYTKDKTGYTVEYFEGAPKE